MNMISTGAFLTEMDASNKQPTVAEKFAAVWEKKNAKAARAGGVSLMALSLAACGGSSDDTTTPATDPEPTTPVVVEPTSENYDLNTGRDVKTLGDGDDTFTADAVRTTTNNGAAEVTFLVETLNATDSLDGGAGADTLTYTTDGAALPAATLSNIETIDIVSTGAVTANTSVASITGVTTLSAKATAGAVDIDTKSDVTSVTVTGSATTVDIDDAGTAATTADALASVHVKGNTGNVTIDSDALTSLKLEDTVDGNATVAIAETTTRAFTLEVDGIVDTNNDVTFTDTTVRTLNVDATGSTSTGLDLAVAKATTLNIDAAAKLTIDTISSAAELKTINIDGSKKVTITDISGTDASLTSIDASDSTGGVVLTPTLAVGTAVTGGSGNDSAKIAATTKAISMGAGDDTVETTVAALGVDGSVAGGDGTDTLKFTTTAHAATASATTGSSRFETTISGFERIEVGAGASAAGTNTINLAGLDEANYVITNGITADGGNANNKIIAFTNLSDGATLRIKGSTTEAGDGTTLTLAGAALGSADTVNIWLDTGVTTGVIAGGSVTAANVETVAISTVDTGTATGADFASAIHTMTLVATSATTVTVTGNNGLNLGGAGSGNTAITSFDASGVAGDSASILDTAANLAVTFVSDNVTTAVTIKGGAGNDTLTADSASVKAHTIEGGAGGDNLTGAAGVDTINGGAGADTIDGNGSADILTGGAGADDFTIDAADTGATVATADTITDFVSGTDTISIGTAGTSTNYSELDGSSYADLAALTAAVDLILDGTIDYVVAYNVAGSGNGYLMIDAGSNGAFGSTDDLVILTGVDVATDFAYGDLVA